MDTGSGYTLVRQATALRLGAEINERRNSPKLPGAVLVMVHLVIGVNVQIWARLTVVLFTLG